MAEITIPGYTILETICEGKHSILLQAHDINLKRDVRVKTLLPGYRHDVDLVGYLQQEARVLAELDHPHLATLLEWLGEPIGPCLVLPSYPVSLRQKLLEGPLSLPVAADFLDQVADAVDIVHLNEMIHGNISPEHIWLDRGENVYLDNPLLEQPWCLDAEFYKVTLPDQQPYLSPEQLAGEQMRIESDVFSLGVVCLECLTGRTELTFLSEPVDILDNPNEIPTLPNSIIDVLRTATYPDPSHRYPSAHRFMRSFRAALPDTRRSLTQPLAEPLTDQELKILELMIADLSNAEIAEELGIAESTVGWHIRQNIHRKLDVHSRKRAIERGIELGLTRRNIRPVAGAKSTTVDEMKRTVVVSGNPYKGLKPFEETDEAVFFGREAFVQRLLASLESGDQFIALVGPSGSGKSSVIQAGLVPALRQSAFPDSERWIIVNIAPGFQPIEELAVAMTQANNRGSSDFLSLLKGNPEGLLQAARQLLPANEQAELVLIVDQFEELFTLVEDMALRQQFIDLLVAAASDSHSRIRIVLALRADFYHRPLIYPQLAHLLGSSSEVIVPLSPEEFELTITGPATRAGLEVEINLVSRIVQDIYGQTSALPLLQYTLMELYEARDGDRLTLAAYIEYGGIVNALSRRADEAYGELDSAGQVATQQIFLRLITLGEGAEDTLRRTSLSELHSIISEKTVLNEVLDIFGRYRLLIFDHDPEYKTGTVQIAHEALIRNWSRLQDWLTDYRDDLRLQHQLLRDTTTWQQEGQIPGLLATATKLDRYEALLRQSRLAFSGLEQDFLSESLTRRNQEQEARQREVDEKARLNQRIVRLLLIGGIASVVALIVVLILLVIADNNQREAASQTQIALSHQLAALALVEMQNPVGNDEYAALLAVRSLQHGYDPAADEALVQTMDRLPLRLLADTGTMVTAIAYAPDGNSIFAGGIDGSLIQLNTSTGEVIRIYEGHTDEIWRVDVSADGQFVLSGSSDDTAVMWNTTTGQSVYTFGPGIQFRTAAFSPDGDLILTGSMDGFAKLWHRATGEEMITLVNDGEGIASGAFSRDGRHVILGTGDNGGEIWDISTNERIITFSGHSEYVYTMATSPDGRYLVTGSTDNTARLWDLDTGEELTALTNHSSSVRSVTFSPDSQYVLTASADRTVRLWNVLTGEEIERFRAHQGRVRAIAMSPSGDHFATGSEDGTIKLWAGPNYVSSMNFTNHEGEVFGVAFSPNGNFIATSGADGTARLWDASTGQQIQIFRGHEGIVTSVAFSPDGHYLLTGGIDTTARLWDMVTGNEVLQFDEHTLDIWSIAYTPDGEAVLTSSLDQTVRLWDISTGEVLKTFEDTENRILAVAISPDGSKITTGGEDFLGRTWDVTTGEFVTTLNGHESEINSVAFSPDGSIVATGSRDNTVRLWNVETGEHIRTLEGHTNTVVGVVFTTDGKYVITSSADRSARVWQVADGRLIRIYRGHKGALWRVAISPDNQQVVTAGLDGVARVWGLSTQDLMDHACKMLLRDLTTVERDLAFITNTQPTCPIDS